ncbi:hypothetical protein ACAF76_005130 [Brevibacillus sp. TJ4]|uniref:hypothetical protein n=1 Tax=Brevibacillus sp. TJ4 TaxID=3234853 RepID=UPI0037D2CB69
MSSIATFIPILIALAFYAFVLYLIIMVLRFMKEKTLHDRQRNEKLDQLIELLRERERKQE